MTADERLMLIQHKIARANKHIVDLQQAIKDFLATGPYKVGFRRDATTRKPIYYVTEAHEAPPALALITGDIVQNLRSALDHLAYQLFLVGTGGSVGIGSHVYFPIADSSAKFASELARKVRGMRQDAIDAIRALEPYKQGKGHDLWIIHALNNIDKHRLLFTVGGAFQSVNIGAVLAASFRNSFGKELPDAALPDLYLRPADVLCPLKAGSELFIDAPDAAVNDKIDFRFNVSLNETGVLESAQLPDAVQKLSGLVATIAQGFKPYLD
jgi:hypothetical protein